MKKNRIYVDINNDEIIKEMKAMGVFDVDDKTTTICDKTEIWKDITDYVGFYQISNYGNIRSLDRYYISNRKEGMVSRFFKGRMLTLSVDVTGYYCVNLFKDQSHTKYRIHNLVANEFLPRNIEKPHINHKDSNKLNNHVSNLEWCTQKENINHCFDAGLNSSANKIKLIRKEDGTKLFFRSQIRASKFMGKNKNYISIQLRRLIFENDKYKWELL